MKSDKFNRRQVLVAVTASAVVATLPLPTLAPLSPEFAVLRVRMFEGLAALNAARDARTAARAQISAAMKASSDPLRTFFDAPEVRARGRARRAARAVAEEIMFTPTTNEAELALQVEAREIYEGDFGGDDGIRRGHPKHGNYGKT